MEDLQKTIKKAPIIEIPQYKDETATKSKKNNPHNFVFPIDTRLSQMSIFGGANNR